MDSVIRTLIKVLIGVAVGLGIGLFFSHTQPIVNIGSLLRSGAQGLTNPLLDCDTGDQTIGVEKLNFTPALKQMVASEQTQLGIADIAVYYRDLDNGPTFGINSTDPFVPASILKLPIMMAVLKGAEENPGLLNKKVLYSEKNTPDPDVGYIPSEPLVDGKEYTVDELVAHMIKDSDNRAMFLLAPETPLTDIQHLFTLLGVDPNILSNRDAKISAKEYSAFFRILFNASFLTQSDSEKALKLLTQTTFTEGLRAGVPASVTVAHKYGISNADGMGNSYLHDCGIIYYPNHPYSLCVMTKGDTVGDMVKAIADISTFVYQKVESQYKIATTD